MIILDDQVYGSLIGLALGDALGMPVELWPREMIVKKYGQINDFLPGRKVSGSVTDDTEQTIIIAQSIIKEKGKINSKKIADQLLTWMEKNNKLDKLEMSLVGPSSRQALLNYKKGISLTETGKNGDTNGSAMRIVPAGIITRSDRLEKLVDRVEKICLPTHNTDVAIAGASAVAAAVSTALDNKPLNAIFDNALKAMKLGYKKGYKTSNASLIKRTYLVFDIINKSNFIEEALDNIYNLIGSGLLITETIPVVLAIVKLSEGYPLKAALMAVNHGGDTDTIAAISAAICGAFKGSKSIPDHYKKKVIKVNKLNLEIIAEKLLKYRD